MRALFLILCFGAATAMRKNPAADGIEGAMEGIGNTAGTVQGGVDSTGKAVGADKVGEGAGSVVTGTGDAVGGAASSVGDATGVAPKQVGVVGGGTVPTALKCPKGSPKFQN